MQKWRILPSFLLLNNGIGKAAVGLIRGGSSLSRSSLGSIVKLASSRGFPSHLCCFQGPPLVPALLGAQEDSAYLLLLWARASTIRRRSG
ncbi:hypothetical protein CRG98_037978 [Punica granatum]|uniref:Uncharacterized protein n=1 Tax=Punica granatum TaxID=22663 RepID=A0A2I0ICF6_PUNGR|nr:hypothetical protein CRG98_037978 [Punica granatum]